MYHRDGWCLNCGDPHSADGAHVIRRSQGGDDSPANVIRLCRSCHSAFDEYRLELPESIHVMLEGEKGKNYKGEF